MTCDVVPIQVSHLLLGRPYQFDMQVIFNGYSNKYSFVLTDWKVTLVPLTPKQVYEDQVQLKKKSMSWNAKRKRERKRAERGRKAMSYKEAVLCSVHKEKLECKLIC